MTEGADLRPEVAHLQAELQDAQKMLLEKAMLSANAGSDATSEDPGDLGNSATVDRKTYDRVVRKFGTAMLQPASRVRTHAFFTALSNLQADEIPALMRLFRRLNQQGLSYPEEWNALWVRAGEINGGKAVEYLLGNSNAQWAEGSIKNAFQGWASTDAKGPIDWLTTHEDSPFYEQAFIGYINGYSERDLDASTKMVKESMPATHPLASKAMETLAEAAVRHGQLRGMQEWFDSLPNEGGQQSFKFSAFMHVWWRTYHANPEMAQQFLADTAAQPWRDDRMYDVMTRKLAESEPSNALKWAATLSPSPKDGRWPGVAQAAQAWMRKDPVTANAWINEQPESPFLDYLNGTIGRGRQPQ